MKHKKYDLGNYSLYTIFTDRFKTINLKVNIRIKWQRENDKYMPMLWRMLIRTSKKYDSLKEINRACAEIYDPYFSMRVLESGTKSILSLSASFINEKYTEKGMNEKNIKFFLPFLFEPKIINNGFDREIFEKEKEKLINSYKEIKDYPRDYVRGQIEYYMENREYREYSLEEIIEETEKLTSEELYAFYKEVMKNGMLDIFISGNIDFEKTKKIFENNIKFKGKKEEKVNHLINHKMINKEIKKIEEESHNIQTNVAIGYKITNMTKFEREYVLSIYSWILGGGMNSLLHREVREKNSLCYYIYTVRDKIESTLKIFTGIDYKDYDKVYDLINKQINKIKKGSFSSKMIDNVKKLYISSLKSIEDYEDDFIGSYISEIYTGSDSIEKRKENIEKVTKEDLMKFAKKVHLDTIFILKGDENE